VISGKITKNESSNEKKLLTIRMVARAKENLTNYTRSSADADNRLDAFSGQSRSTNMVPFHM